MKRVFCKSPGDWLSPRFFPFLVLFACIMLLLSLALTHEPLAALRSYEEKVTSGGPQKLDNRTCVHEARVERGRAVYLRNCQGCHGVCGGGDGVYAPTLRDKPRDFTAGVYKWRSTPTGELPTDEDLMRTISRGIPQSGMPAFAAMRQQDLRAVIAYIKSLSPRFTGNPRVEPIAIQPEPEWTMESAEKGRRVYDRMVCAACHGATGDGWGPLAAELVDDDGNPIRPANLTGTTWKSGCLGQDLYRSILTGLDGTPMPAYEKELNPDEVWPLVHYIQSLGP